MAKNFDIPTPKKRLLSLQMDPKKFEPATDAEKRQQDVMAESTTFFRDGMRRLMQNPLAVMSMVILLLVILMMIFAPLFVPYGYEEMITVNGVRDPAAANLAPFHYSALEQQYIDQGGKIFPHIMGTDELSRDYFIRVVYGTRVSFLVGVFASLMVLIIGVLYGAISGYAGGRVDLWMMRIVDIIYSLPDLLIIILLAVVFKESLDFSQIPIFANLGTNMVSMFIVFGLLYWVGMARLVRGQILTIKENEYVLAAKSIGASAKRIVQKHIIPNIISVIIIMTAQEIPAAIFTESYLSFIGLGVALPMPSLGSLANAARSGMQSYPWKLRVANPKPHRASSDHPVLSVENLHTSFITDSGEVKAVNGVSFNLDAGKILGVVGESGSGKSVTAYSILQILDQNGRIVEGDIKFKGKSLLEYSQKEMDAFRGNNCSIIFQDPMTSLNPVFTVGYQMNEALKLHTKYNTTQLANERSKQLLEMVGVNEPEKRLKQYPFELSGGMRQRVMIAMALACEPDILIADEPTTALDVTIQAQILELMKDLQKELGMAIILVTHDLGVIASMCDEIIVMYGGRVCERGTAEDIFYRPAHEYTKGLLKSIPNVDNMKERLVPIAGTPINLLNMPKGCAFCPRCDNAMKVCLEEVPEELQMPDGHFAACWMNLRNEYVKEHGKEVS